LDQAIDTMIFSPREAGEAAAVAAVLEFALHILPLGAAADNFSQGNYGEAAISLAGDAAMLMTGGMSKVLVGARHANKLRAIGIVTEASIAGIRGVQGALKLYNGEGGWGEIAEAILRVFGVKMSIANKADEAARVAKNLASAASGVSDNVGNRIAQLSENVMCFARDTLVSTKDGLRPIGEIEPGDRVHAFDFASGVWTLAEIIQRHDNVYHGKVFTIWAGSSRIETTINHPFWVVQGNNLVDRPVPPSLSEGQDEEQALPGRWVNSQDLRPGDVLLSQDRRCLLIEAVDERWEESLPVSNLAVRDHHTFAVGSNCLLVHNDSWCDVLRKKIGDGKLNALKATLQSLKEAGKVTADLVVHAHHIVMKMVPKHWSDEAKGWVQGAQEILERNGVDLLATRRKLRNANSSEIHNLSWAINGYQGIHSYAYAKAVFDKLKAADLLGPEHVKNALKQMADILEKGEKFW
jgi:hypothetical protein